MKKQKIKPIPKFKNEDEEFEFWSTHSTMDYFDKSKAYIGRFPNLKPTTKSISIRLPEMMIFDLKTKANKMDVPYQALIKILLELSLKELESKNVNFLTYTKKQEKHKRLQN